MTPGRDPWRRDPSDVWGPDRPTPQEEDYVRREHGPLPERHAPLLGPPPRLMSRLLRWAINPRTRLGDTRRVGWTESHPDG